MHLSDLAVTSIRPSQPYLPSLTKSISSNNVLPSINNLNITLPPISDILRKSQPQPQPPVTQQQPIQQPQYYNHYTPMNQHQLQHRISPVPPQVQHLPPQPYQMIRNNSYPVPSNTNSIINPSLSPRSIHQNNNNINSRKTRNNLPKEITYILLRWLHDHINHPYPNSFEKNQLMMATGLNQQQLSNWFINARRRKIKGIKEQKD